MFNKKNKIKNKKNKNNIQDTEEIILSEEKRENKQVLKKGMRSLKDIIAPVSINRGEEDSIVVGKKYARNFVINGYPTNVFVGWLDDIIHGQTDMDTAIYINPADDREALEELTSKITQYEAQLAVEREKGNIRNTTRLNNLIVESYRQREKLELRNESIFYVEITSNLYSDNKEELDKETERLDNKLRGKKIYLMPTYLRQDDGYKSALPFGTTYIPDEFRNFNSGALTACFPFYNSEIYHEKGVYCGENLSTRTPIMIDFYDRSLLNNSNVTVFGQAGSGKSFFVSLLTMRSTINGIRTIIIDPEGEYKRVTHAMNGSHIYIAPDSEHFINPFDIEEEVKEGTNEVIVNIKDKVSDLLNLIGVMAGGLTGEQRSIVAYILAKVYEDRGFTEDARSLINNEPFFDDETGEFYQEGRKKPMPTFSDFHERLEEHAKKENNKELIALANSLKIFKKGGVYDMFDTQTSKDLVNFKDSTVVTFDISKLEESVLRPIGMYIALSWTWEKFAKKNPHIRKRIICDEAWMLVNKNMAGFEYTSQFLETCSRRIRKRNGGLLVASQNFVEFINNEQGKAVLTNAFTNIFLKQDSTDIDALQDTFKLSDGERNFLLQARKGEFLVKIHGESCIGYAKPFEMEKDIITNKVSL